MFIYLPQFRVSLQDAPKDREESQTSLRLSILEIGNVEPYNNKDRKVNYVNAIVAEGERKVVCRVHLLQLRPNSIKAQVHLSQKYAYI